MKIIEKINMDRQGLEENGPINIVVFGDSVTHGALHGSINYETVYWNRLRQKINKTRSYVPVNVICAGIGGASAKGSLGRIDRDIVNHSPDLVIVCFGLNDVNGTLENFVEPMRTIFEKSLATGAEVIYLTPNMLNTYVAPDTSEGIRSYAEKTAEHQNGGRMDEYIGAVVKLAEELGVSVCDCYSEWKKLHASGVDTTKLLINRINHPTEKMHELFTDMLYDTIFKTKNFSAEALCSTMYS